MFITAPELGSSGKEVSGFISHLRISKLTNLDKSGSEVS